MKGNIVVGLPRFLSSFEYGRPFLPGGVFCHAFSSSFFTDKNITPVQINQDASDRRLTFIQVLLDNEIKISMDGKGRAIDNVFIERLWRDVKYEKVYLNSYSTGIELYRGLQEYFEFHNNERVHESLDYKFPCEFYNQAA